MASDGGVFNFGGAIFYGSMGGQRLAAPIVGMASTPSGKGYWLLAKDGGVFSFGDAPFYGSMAGKPLNSPIVGIAADPRGTGYWLVAADGGIFAFPVGSEPFYGSMGGQPLNSPIVGMAANPLGGGYWLVAADGGIFSFPIGKQPFYGSMGGQRLNSPVVGMGASPRGDGYWLVAADGGIFSFPIGKQPFYGSMGGQPLNAPIVGMEVSSTGDGYWLLGSDGGVFAFGSATYSGRITYAPAPPPPVQSAQSLAQQIMAMPNRVALATSHPSSVRDNATAFDNVNDVANGGLARRSSYGNAPGGVTLLSAPMLKAVITIGKAHTISVSEIAGGSHAVGSIHYTGRAIDINKIDGKLIASGGDWNTLRNMCIAAGAANVYDPKHDPDGTHGTHVHCDWSSY